MISLAVLCLVALRKESVDRNCVAFCLGAKADRSLSARRAWIEIINNNYNDLTRPVALRKESVDRNCRYPARCVGLLCRSPQGERG